MTKFGVERNPLYETRFSCKLGIAHKFYSWASRCCMSMLADEKAILLREIRDGVRLIAAAMAEPLRKRLNEEFLTSGQRKKMYVQFDGLQAYDTIAGKAGVTAEAVRQFAVTLERVGFVTFEKRGGKTCPRRAL